MSKKPEVVNLSKEEAERLQTALSASNLEEGDKDIITKIIIGYCWIKNMLQEARISLHRLKGFFGFSGKTTEKKTRLSPKKNTEDKKKPKGHGRTPLKKYWGAKVVNTNHEHLKAGDLCEECGGRLHAIKPKTTLALKGHSLVSAEKHVLESLKCWKCDKVYTAKAPRKYDSSVAAAVATGRYYNGFPNYRIQEMQKAVGVPLPDATQWDLIKGMEPAIRPIFEEMVELASQGEVMHSDDTSVKILDVAASNKTKGEKERTGMYTTGIISKVQNFIIALFISGIQHAGENMKDLLVGRMSTLIRMSDALSRNVKGANEVYQIIVYCIAHARRKFYEIYEYFPEACEWVLKRIALIYKHDYEARDMSPDKRMKYHKKHSGPIIEEMKGWMEKQLEDKTVEPNSSLGKAMLYMLKRWKNFTRFLDVPGCPLDNNIVERALKIPIRARKNSLFYKTEFGAEMGSMITSIIHTCVLAKKSPMDYLTTLLNNEGAVIRNPKAWLPWNYEQHKAA